MSNTPHQKPEKAATNANAFRTLVLDSYLSQSNGIHRPLDDADYRQFARAYAYHLRGWVPSPKPAAGAWLDLACGQGALMLLARQLGFSRVEGVDVSDEMLASARARGLLAHAGDVATFLAATPSAQWDVISLFDILEHFPRDEAHQVLTQVRRALVPGGICLIKVPNLASPLGPSVQASDLTHETSFSPPSLECLSKLAGFRGCELREVGPAPTSAIAQARAVLWRGLRLTYALANAIETGSPGDGIYTRIMLAKLQA